MRILRHLLSYQLKKKKKNSIDSIHNELHYYLNTRHFPAATRQGYTSTCNQQMMQSIVSTSWDSPFREQRELDDRSKALSTSNETQTSPENALQLIKYWFNVK